MIKQNKDKNITMSQVSMPSAVALWLVDNTILTTKQIAEFCSVSEMEIKAILNGDACNGIKPKDPILAGYTTREAIDASENDQGLKLQRLVTDRYTVSIKKAKPYISISLREKRLNAIMWFVDNAPLVSNATLRKFLGTTTSTVERIRKKEHPKMDEIVSKSPVLLGFCSQLELQSIVEKAENDEIKAAPKKKVVKKTK